MNYEETALAIWTRDYEEWDRLRREHNPLARHYREYSKDQISECCANWDAQLKDGWVKK